MKARSTIRFILPAQKCCLQLPLGSRFAGPSPRSSQPRRCQSVSAEHRKVAAGNCDEEKYGVTAHSRFAGQELDLICNHNFV
ncbi:MAG TPA: hypothetical protein DIT76_01665 [Spartobacteria bacterium]|nr:hypothetical protein [Spartobacteria bacterium]HCP90746.1 hypothetical protein [Spartobacteria bacterium]